MQLVGTSTKVPGIRSGSGSGKKKERERERERESEKTGRRESIWRIIIELSWRKEGKEGKERLASFCVVCVFVCTV